MPVLRIEKGIPRPIFITGGDSRIFWVIFLAFAHFICFPYTAGDTLGKILSLGLAFGEAM